MDVFTKAKGLFDVVTGGAITGQTGQLIWKYPHTMITSGSILQVNPTQEAVFFKSGGGGFELLGPGEYPVETKLIPFLSKIMNLPFGKNKTPYSTHIWFINKTVDHTFPWGTAPGTQVELDDPKFEGTYLKVGVGGQTEFKIVDTLTLFDQLAGATPESFGIEDLVIKLKQIVVNEITGILQNYGQQVREAERVKEENMRRSLLDMRGANKQLDALILESLQPYFRRYGLQVEICSSRLKIVEDDNYRLIQSYSARLLEAKREAEEEDRIEMRRIEREKKRLEMMGVSYTADRQIDVAQTFAGNEGTGATNVAGMGAGIGMMGVMASQMQNVVQPALQAPPPQQPPAGGVVCPGCGVSQSPAKFCMECGTPLEKRCPACNNPGTLTQKFCNECGSPMDKKCACGATPAPGQKFCNECGQKL